MTAHQKIKNVTLEKREGKEEEKFVFTGTLFLNSFLLLF